VGLTCIQCSFSLGVPLEIGFQALHQKITKKIRLFRGNEPSNLIIKWLDAEGDEISLRCDADVEAMFDEARELAWIHISLIAKG
jgi:cell division control protein 24